MTLTIDLFIQSVVVASFFLMVRSLPRIGVTLISFKTSVWYLLRIHDNDPFFQNHPQLLSKFPKYMVDQWKDDKTMISLLNGELRKLHELRPAFIECIVSAAMLLLGGYSLGMDWPTTVIVWVLVLFLVVALSILLAMDNKYQHSLNERLYKLYSNPKQNDGTVTTQTASQ